MRSDRPPLHSLFIAQRMARDMRRWRPAVDIYKGKQCWVIKVELAGVNPEDVEIELGDCRLTVRGIRRDWRIVEDQQAWSMEIAYNQFERTIEVPCDMRDVRIEQEYRNGMFLITLQMGACES